MRSKIIIVDSSALVAITNQQDASHTLAISTAQAFSNDTWILIPAEVFAETLNVIGKKIGRPEAIKAGREIMTSAVFTIHHTNPEVRAVAFEKFQTQPASVSFTDCIVMAFADSFKTKEIFGFDERFAKAGYIRLGIDQAAKEQAA